ncbi:ATP-binding protein [Desulfatitalea alkaliphila]|uniref:histidine kinase n=1 Tax=Desulfatitalea alkaliphila TaxID=2929485 RepID=A0AA41UGZ9_9BACT|nr:ATP-binding protein [Desulfatitalea alkaliphila]MCJ8499080.1 cell wall metabolism sensor histidine kinase WalK [Desulfatitalea alkaliphila]
MMRRRLVWQIYPAYLILLLLVLLATGWYASRVMYRFHLDRVQQELLHQTRLLIPRLEPLLTPLQAAALDDLCKWVGRSVPSRITVVLPDGKVAADSEADPAAMENHGRRPEIVQALGGAVGTDLRFSETIDRHMMYLAVPVGTGTPVGVARVAMALTEIQESLRALQIRFFQGGLAIAALASLICFWISRRISRPIEEMRRGADRFAAGDLSHRLVPPDTVEMASLARAMNQMAAELEKRIQSVIRQRNETEAVLASMMEGVLALDQREAILHLNDAAVRLLNEPAEALQGRSIQEVVRNRELHRMVRETLDGKESAVQDIVLYQASERVLATRCTPLMDAAGQRMGALLVLNDVTQLRRLETMRSDFAANVSHEIKTPLTAIQGFVETLAQDAVDDPREAQRFLEIILKHVRRLVTIIDDLMQLACLEGGGRMDGERLRPAPVRQLLETVIDLCRRQAEEKAIRVVVDCPEGVKAFVDRPLMEQALFNLLDNAIKYSPADSVVTVSAAPAEQQVRICFQDQGLGIPRHHLPRLFERFYRVDKARSRQMGGTGLGLAIVKHIVQAHGGQVDVESREGAGSIFTIRLPNP